MNNKNDYDFLTGIMVLRSVRDYNGRIFDFEWTLVSPGSEKIVGRYDLIQKRLLEELPGHYTKDLFEIYVSVVETGEALNISHSYQHEEGKNWYEIHAVKWEDGVIVNCNNVTGLRNTLNELVRLNTELEEKVEKRTEELNRSKHQLRLIIDSVPNLISYLDSNLNVTFYNHTYRQWFGEEACDVIGHNFENFAKESEWNKAIPYLHQALTGKSVWFNHELHNKEGNNLKLKTAFIPEKNQEGKVVGMVITSTDLTEERNAKERLMAILNNVPIAIWAINREGIITLAEGKGIEALGIKADQLIGQSALMLFKYFPETFHDIKKAVNGGSFTGKTNLSGVTYQTFYYPIKNEAGKLTSIGGVSTDITDRVKIQEELMASEAKYKAMAEGIPQLVWTANPKGEKDFFNQNWYKYTGLSTEESLNNEWHRAIHPNDLPLKIEKWKYSVETGKELEYECRYRRALDGMYRWHLVRGWPVKNAKGEILKWLGTSTDIHDRKKQTEELQHKNQELVKTNNDLDNFIYTASHDLKSPISNIEGLLNTIQDEIDTECGEAIRTMINMTEFSLLRLKGTISELTEISQIQRNITEDIDLINIEEAIEEFKIEHRDQINNKNAEIKTSLEIASIKYSRRNFRSILYNILNNAIKYSHPERPPVIEITTRMKRPGCMSMSIADNGIGMDISQKEKIFGMFKRLHNHVEGTGVGLYIVKRIMENTGGEVDVESEIGKGSIFKLYFNLHNQIPT